MTLETYRRPDSAILRSPPLTGGRDFAGNAPNEASGFLLEPGGQDYVGDNSYDGWADIDCCG
jgi:hypothetical protein